jgi:hypothetical protein
MQKQKQSIAAVTLSTLWFAAVYAGRSTAIPSSTSSSPVVAEDEDNEYDDDDEEDDEEDAFDSLPSTCSLNVGITSSSSMSAGSIDSISRGAIAACMHTLIE